MITWSLPWCENKSLTNQALQAIATPHHTGPFYPVSTVNSLLGESSWEAGCMTASENLVWIFFFQSGLTQIWMEMALVMLLNNLWHWKMGIVHPIFQPSELLIPFTIVSFWIGSEGWVWAAWWCANSPPFSRINYSHWWLGKRGPVMLWISFKVPGGFRVWTTGFSWILPRLNGFGFWGLMDAKGIFSLVLNGVALHQTDLVPNLEGPPWLMVPPQTGANCG